MNGLDKDLSFWYVRQLTPLIRVGWVVASMVFPYFKYAEYSWIDTSPDCIRSTT